ncbi:hypothetical protein [Kitasatospora herbaricolor]|uniref:Uncharacterized protein n=1 Tax=Kitasatospora herbaricolor TaxID=68217 RepID=A0ABZ1WF57_9ACTN|nr:hypothetical protein [Kitasatospora herbaricolor]
MSGGLPLVGLVASVRIQASLLLPVSLVSCVPAYVWGPHRLDLTASVAVALLLFATTFSALLKARRPWYETRLAQMTPPPPTAELVARDQTFDLFSRGLTKPLLLVLLIGLALSYATGMPAGMLLAGLAAAMLRQSRCLAAEEKRLGGRIVCLHTPVHVTADDPNGPAYRRARFWIVREVT